MGSMGTNIKTGTGQYSDPGPEDIKLIPNSGIEHEPTTPSHTRTGESKTRIWVWSSLPLTLHFVSVLTLTAVVTTYIDENDFNLHSRHALSTFTPLQSDITTTVSSCIAIYRVFAAMWSTAMIWRCIFILMGRGGISLEQINSLLTWQIHIHQRRKSTQGFGLLVSVILLASFPSQLSGPILTGSITWSSSHRLADGGRITRISGGYPGDLSLLLPEHLPLLSAMAPGIASVAWLGSPEGEKTMKRVIRSIGHIPINSTFNNITLPYFSVSKLEWIRDPMKEVPQIVTLSMNNYSDLNPLGNVPVVASFALTPDTWGGVSSFPSPYSGIISETRVIVGIYGSGNCTSSDTFGDLAAHIGFNVLDKLHCLIYGRVTYLAGQDECRDCRVSSRNTVQNDTALTVSPSKEALYAVDMMKAVGVMMTLQNNSLPRPYNNLDRYVTELMIRSYAASWTYLRALIHSPSWISTGVQLAIPTSHANVLWWRVWLWFWLNLLFTLSGLFFQSMQLLSGQQLVGNPQVAALLLDTSNILHKRDRAFCDFSTLAKDDEGMGYLQFTRDRVQGDHRQVEIVEE